MRFVYVLLFFSLIFSTLAVAAADVEQSKTTPYAVLVSPTDEKIWISEPNAHELLFFPDGSYQQILPVEKPLVTPVTLVKGKTSSYFGGGSYSLTVHVTGSPHNVDGVNFGCSDPKGIVIPADGSNPEYYSSSFPSNDLVIQTMQSSFDLVVSCFAWSLVSDPQNPSDYIRLLYKNDLFAPVDFNDQTPKEITFDLSASHQLEHNLLSKQKQLKTFYAYGYSMVLRRENQYLLLSYADEEPYIYTGDVRRMDPKLFVQIMHGLHFNDYQMISGLNGASNYYPGGVTLVSLPFYFAYPFTSADYISSVRTISIGSDLSSFVLPKNDDVSVGTAPFRQKPTVKGSYLVTLFFKAYGFEYSPSRAFVRSPQECPWCNSVWWSTYIDSPVIDPDLGHWFYNMHYNGGASYLQSSLTSFKAFQGLKFDAGVADFSRNSFEPVFGSRYVSQDNSLVELVYPWSDALPSNGYVYTNMPCFTESFPFSATRLTKFSWCGPGTYTVYAVSHNVIKGKNPCVRAQYTYDPLATPPIKLIYKQYGTWAGIGHMCLWPAVPAPPQEKASFADDANFRFIALIVVLALLIALFLTTKRETRKAR